MVLNIEIIAMNSSQNRDIVLTMYSDSRSVFTLNDVAMLVGEGDFKKMKKFVRTKLSTETISLLRFYKEFPILAE